MYFILKQFIRIILNINKMAKKRFAPKEAQMSLKEKQHEKKMKKQEAQIKKRKRKV